MKLSLHPSDRSSAGTRTPHKVHFDNLHKTMYFNTLLGSFADAAIGYNAETNIDGVVGFHYANNSIFSLVLFFGTEEDLNKFMMQL